MPCSSLVYTEINPLNQNLGVNCKLLHITLQLSGTKSQSLLRGHRCQWVRMSVYFDLKVAGFIVAQTMQHDRKAS